jgi:hypothetical protein
VPHRFIVAPIFQLPFGKDKIGRALGNAVAGGWMLAAAFNFRAGSRSASQSSSGTNLLGNNLRPNVTGTPVACSGDLAACLGRRTTRRW